MLFFHLQILHIYDIYKQQLGTIMYKHFNHYLPDHFGDYFVFNSDIHSLYTQSPNLCNLFSHLLQHLVVLIYPLLVQNFEILCRLFIIIIS